MRNLIPENAKAAKVSPGGLWSYSTLQVGLRAYMSLMPA